MIDEITKERIPIECVFEFASTFKQYHQPKSYLQQLFPFWLKME
jgi:hypothetical protein